MARRGRNEGTIFRKANGSWRAQVSIEGKRLSYTAWSRAECLDWLRRTQTQIDDGLTFQSRNLTLGEYLDDWMAAKELTLRARSIDQYAKLIALYLKPMLGKVKLKDLSLQSIERLYGRLRDKDVGLSNIRYAHRVLHAALEDAAKRGIIGRNSAHGATLPKRTQREMSILNEQQVGAFLVAASTSRFGALFHLALATGMRFSELRGLSWSDVDWIKGTVTVRRQIQEVSGKGSVAGAPKTRSGVRTILLGEACLNSLRQQRQRLDGEKERAGNGWQEQGLIFPSKVGTPFVPLVVRRDFANALQAANLLRIRFHDLRHTAASLMLSHGVSALVVSKILGHSNPSITLSIYAHSTTDMQGHAASVMDGIVMPVAISLPQLHPIAPNCTRG
jgi:integrase